MASRFWVGGTGTWDVATTTHWSTTSGGAGGASVPLSTDDVTFDAASGGGTVTPNYDFNVHSITMGAFTGTLDFSANNNSPTIDQFFANGTGVRTLNLGSGTFIITSSVVTGWNISTTTNLTFNAGTSTIKFTQTGSGENDFLGGSLTYNNLWFARGASTGINKITGSNTFNNLKDTGTVAHQFQFTAGTTTTVASWNIMGNAGNLITITSDTTATHSLVKTGGGTISTDFLNIQHSVATPGTTWYAGANSVNNQGVATAGSGWIFTAPTTVAEEIVNTKREVEVIALRANFTPNSALGRALNTTFMPSATRPTWVSYSINILTTNNENGLVELRSDAASPPTTIRASRRSSFSVSGILGVTGNGNDTNALNFLVPAGHYVRLVTTNTAGTPTFSIVSQTEITL